MHLPEGAGALQVKRMTKLHIFFSLFAGAVIKINSSRFAEWYASNLSKLRGSVAIEGYRGELGYEVYPQ